MPAKSKAQQALMGQAYAVKIGIIEPSELDPKYRKEIVKLSKSMTLKQLKDFASTKTKKLPDHVDEKESSIDESNGIVMEPVSSGTMPKFVPSGPGKIVPFLDTDSKQKKKGKRNLQNLKDYRDWLNDDK
jgi:hypothetical protein